jgi:hypothetical protein
MLTQRQRAKHTKSTSKNSSCRALKRYSVSKKPFVRLPSPSPLPAGEGKGVGRTQPIRRTRSPAASGGGLWVKNELF